MQCERDYEDVVQAAEVHIPFSRDVTILSHVPVEHYIGPDGEPRLYYLDGDTAYHVISTFNMLAAHRIYKIYADLLVCKKEFKLFRFYLEPRTDAISSVRRYFGGVPPRAYLDHVTLSIRQLFERKTAHVSSTVASLVKILAAAPKPVLIRMPRCMEGVLDMLPVGPDWKICRTIAEEQEVSKRRRLKMPNVLITFVDTSTREQLGWDVANALSEPDAKPTTHAMFLRVSRSSRIIKRSKLRNLQAVTTAFPAIYLLPWTTQITVNAVNTTKVPDANSYSIYTVNTTRTNFIIDEEDHPSCSIIEHALEPEDIEAANRMTRYPMLSNRLIMGKASMAKRVTYDEFLEAGRLSRIREVTQWRLLRDIAFICERKCREQLLQSATNDGDTVGTRIATDEEDLAYDTEEDAEASVPTEEEDEGDDAEEGNIETDEEDDAEEDSIETEENEGDDAEEDSIETEENEGDDAEEDSIETEEEDDVEDDAITWGGAESIVSRIGQILNHGWVQTTDISPEEHNGLSHKYQEYQIRDMDDVARAIMNYTDDELDEPWTNMLGFTRRQGSPQPVYPDIDLNLPTEVNTDDFLDLADYSGARRDHKQWYKTVVARVKEFDTAIGQTESFWDAVERIDVKDVFEGAVQTCPICLDETLCLISNCRHFICPECFADKPVKTSCGSCRRTNINFSATQPIEVSPYINCLRSIIDKAKAEVLIIRQPDEAQSMIESMLEQDLKNIETDDCFPKDMKGRVLVAKHPPSIPSCVSDVILSLPYCICPELNEGKSCLCNVHPNYYRRLQERPGVVYHVIYHKDTMEESAWGLVKRTV